MLHCNIDPRGRGRLIAAQSTLNLALQGGGAHGAFTWGVLDQLLQEDRFRFDTVSATSAGAVNAVAMLSGLVRGGPEAARQTLRQVWDAIVTSAPADFDMLNPLLASLGKMEPFGAPSMAQIAGLVSPYTFNPFDFNPLRKLLAELIDFDGIARHGKIELLIAATDASTGRARLFTRTELTVDVVLASACLPMLYKAVKIGENNYWDGGFSANPDLVTLARQACSQDTLVVLLTPSTRDPVPTQTVDILSQINRITFNQPLLRDVREILSIRQAMAGPQSLLVSRERKRVAQHRFHLIEAGHYTATLPEISRFRPARATTDKLFEAGVHETEGWLARHAASVGLRETVDLAMRLLPDSAVPLAEKG